MFAKLDYALLLLDNAAHVVPAAELDEARAFLRWIRDNHFTFLGYAEYNLTDTPDGPQIERVQDSKLGVMRKMSPYLRRSTSFQALPAKIRVLAQKPEPPLILTKANTRSTVHRRAYLDYLGIKRFDEQGRVLGEHRFLGLFTSAAYNRNPREIPLLRRKVDALFESAGFAPNSHDGKALLNIIETYPRDELFQAPPEILLNTTLAILDLQERQRTRLFVRQDQFGRYVSCLIYVPRERYTTDLRRRMQTILAEAFDVEEVEFQASLSESVLARVLFTVRLGEGQEVTADTQELENKIKETARTWTDRLEGALMDAVGEEQGNHLLRAYGANVSLGYQEDVDPRAAVIDLQRIDRLARSSETLEVSLYAPLSLQGDALRFRMVHKGGPIILSDVLPVLEDMGLRVIAENGFMVKGAGTSFSIHDFSLAPQIPLYDDVDRLRDLFHEAFTRVWIGDAEIDGFNRLVLAAGLDWREIRMLRAYAKYFLQVGSSFSQDYVEDTLTKHPAITVKLAQLFGARFKPDLDTETREARWRGLAEAIEADLEDVASLDEDRILRRYLDTIRATLRTNAYQRAEIGSIKPYLSLKLQPDRVPDMPLPYPAFEIFVYAPRVEGVHLRGGRVARGGLRWSDRREDFRTEVLGLMKAQQVKNAVIVPVGAKGGFVVKRPPSDPTDRAALMEEGIACYKTFISGLLDITDNRAGDEVVPPREVVRFDEDDPYLVVAADKGTATFSDIANGVAKQYGFWLGDAFASGGSQGYDHKGMGITARGAWESVKRHFYELGQNCQTEPFTCVGVGDMSGDVFGNGMLLSRVTKLIAAFDHRDIFIDPTPDLETSFVERERLFKAGRTTWQDYDKSTISAGGGVYSRRAKSISLSPEARRALGIEEDQPLSPIALINRILKAPVDLLWNGGIGTYVKASTETHGEAADKTNDNLRVSAGELRCKIVGEGGNLGVTQKGRIEFARAGGKINTDAIDNSAGVDCSDHEVNIKILVDKVQEDGDVTEKQRNELLATMTDEVADLVLRDNIMQVRAISLMHRAGHHGLDSQAALMRYLERVAGLNRSLETLPDDLAMQEMRQAETGLTRPHLAVLLAYTKMALYNALLASDLPDEPYLVHDLHHYFPTPLRQRFPERIDQHRLRRELVATILANGVANHGLSLFVSQLQDETGIALPDSTRAYLMAREAFDAARLWQEIEGLETVVPAATQMPFYVALRELLAGGTRWFSTNVSNNVPIEGVVARFRRGCAAIIDGLADVLPTVSAQAQAERTEGLQEAGVDPDLARRLAALPYMLPACDIVEVGQRVNTSELDVARVYFALDDRLDLDALRARFANAQAQDHWQRMALAGVYDDLFSQQRRLAEAALSAGVRDTDGLAEWLNQDPSRLGRTRQLIDEVVANDQPNLALFTVAMRALATLGARPGAAAA